MFFYIFWNKKASSDTGYITGAFTGRHSALIFSILTKENILNIYDILSVHLTFQSVAFDGALSNILQSMRWFTFIARRESLYRFLIKGAGAALSFAEFEWVEVPTLFYLQYLYKLFLCTGGHVHFVYLYRHFI